MGGDKALSPHGSDGSGYKAVIPVYSAPLQDTSEGVVWVGVSETADLHPLCRDVLHGVAKFALMSESSEAAMRSLPPVSNSFNAF